MADEYRDRLERLAEKWRQNLAAAKISHCEVERNRHFYFKYIVALYSLENNMGENWPEQKRRAEKIDLGWYSKDIVFRDVHMCGVYGRQTGFCYSIKQHYADAQELIRLHKKWRRRDLRKTREEGGK
jgi:hypothetical protein